MLSSPLFSSSPSGEGRSGTGGNWGRDSPPLPPLSWCLWGRQTRRQVFFLADLFFFSLPRPPEAER